MFNIFQWWSDHKEKHKFKFVRTIEFKIEWYELDNGKKVHGTIDPSFVYYTLLENGYKKRTVKITSDHRGMQRAKLTDAYARYVLPWLEGADFSEEQPNQEAAPPKPQTSKKHNFTVITGGKQ